MPGMRGPGGSVLAAESVRFVRGRHPAIRRAPRGVSSMAEQRAFNPWVQGSTPWRPTSLMHHPDPDSPTSPCHFQKRVRELTRR